MRRGWAGLYGVAATVLVIASAAVFVALRLRAQPVALQALPLRSVGSLALPGDTSRFDYASLDPAQHLLFVAHLGANQIIEIDTASNHVIRTIDHLDGVHGVLVVPSLHRVFATATNSNQVLTLNEDTGAVLAQARTGDYPDGLAYDPDHARIWVTNESGGSETVIDLAGRLVATVDVGGDAGNVAYDPGHPPGAGQILVDVQSRNEVAVIDPSTLTITRRVAVPGCDHPHGLILDPPPRLGFIACDANASLHTLDLDTFTTSGPLPVGETPDVLALDAATGWLYIAAESGTLTILREHGHRLDPLGRAHLADGAHVVAVDPSTHRSYYPIPDGPGGHPVLLSFDPAN